MAGHLLTYQQVRRPQKPLLRKMKANLHRGLQLAGLFATIFCISATTARCQALLRVTPIAMRNSPLPVRPGYSALHAPARDVFRDPQATRQIPRFRFATYKASRSLQDRLPVKTNDTVFVSQSRVPLVRLWGGRLQIAGFSSTVRMGDVVWGPAAQNAVQGLRLTQQARFSAAHSIDLYGVSLGFRLTPPSETAGRDSIRHLLESIKE